MVLLPVQRLRPAVVLLRREFGRYPLAHARPLLDVEGRELVRVVQEEVGLERSLELVVVRSGQLVLADPAERFHSVVEYADDVVARLKPDARTPDVVMDPRRAFGVLRSEVYGPSRSPRTTGPARAGTNS